MTDRGGARSARARSCGVWLSGTVIDSWSWLGGMSERVGTGVDRRTGSGVRRLLTPGHQGVESSSASAKAGAVLTNAVGRARLAWPRKPQRALRPVGDTAAARRVHRGMERWQRWISSTSCRLQSSDRRAQCANGLRCGTTRPVADLSDCRGGGGCCSDRGVPEHSGSVFGLRRSERFAHMANRAYGRLPGSELTRRVEWAYSTPSEVVPRKVKRVRERNLGFADAAIELNTLTMGPANLTRRIALPRYGALDRGRTT